MNQVVGNVDQPSASDEKISEVNKSVKRATYKCTKLVNPPFSQIKPTTEWFSSWENALLCRLDTPNIVDLER